MMDFMHYKVGGNSKGLVDKAQEMRPTVKVIKGDAILQG